MWNLVPCLGIKPRPSALGAQSLNRWTTREVRKLLSRIFFLKGVICLENEHVLQNRSKLVSSWRSVKLCFICFIFPFLTSHIHVLLAYTTKKQESKNFSVWKMNMLIFRTIPFKMYISHLLSMQTKIATVWRLFPYDGISN